MSKTLYIDIDSTIWDTNETVLNTLKRDLGIEAKYEDITYWGYYEDLVGGGEGWFNKVFKDAFDPYQVYHRELYPGVEDALHTLWTRDNFRFHFLSHNPEPTKMIAPVNEWLHSKLTVPFRLTIFGARNCKINFMDTDTSAWGIVEDKPSTLAKAAKNGYATIAKSHPYNLTTIDQYDIISFGSWSEVPALVRKEIERGDRIAVARG